MPHQNTLFALLAVSCYGLALLTSTALVRWVLPPRFCRELGGGNRNIPLDGIRGFLALGVFLHHCLITWVYLGTRSWQSPPLDFENELGRGAVAVFFMITAFLFWGRVQARQSLDLRQFALSRLFRVYPLYLFLLILVGTSVAWKTGWTLREPIGQIATEIFLWLTFRMPDINHLGRTDHLVAGVLWSLRYEAWFYLSLPLAAFVFFKSKAVVKKVLAVAASATLYYLAGLDWSVATAFAGGVLAVYWRTDPRRTAWAKTRPASVIAIASLVYVAIFRTEPFDAIGILSLSVFFVILASGNTLFGLLARRGALWMGEVSYSMYLCHGFFLWLVVQNLLRPLPFFHLSGTWFALVVLGLTPFLVMLSSASYLLIERPFIHLGHQLGKRNSEPSLVPELIARPLAGVSVPALSLEYAAAVEETSALAPAVSLGDRK